MLSYIFISHDMKAVRAMSDRIAVMKDGKFVEVGSREQIFDNPQTRAVFETEMKKIHTTKSGGEYTHLLDRMVPAGSGKMPAYARMLGDEYDKDMSRGQIAEALRSGGRLGYFGAGTSGKIAILDATDCPQTFGIDENLIQSFIAGGDECIRASVNGAEDNAELAVKDLETFNAGAGDVVVGISASGNPAYVVSVLAEARRRGAKTVAVTSNPQAKFKPYADVFINPLVGSEAIDGSSRMKSGSAQKMILNMISTGAMIRLGKTYENLMIDVNVSNEKLYRRALDMIERITGVNRGVAEKCLLAADKNVKTACVMAAMDCPPAEAERLLAQNDGSLRKVIQQGKENV